MVLRILAVLVIFATLGLGLPRLITALYALPRLYRVDQAPARPVAIVFGAGLWWDGRPTPVLRDRVATAVELYLAGKVQKLLMSGTSTSPGYNEPLAMAEYAQDLGVPAKDIVQDYAGRRTYDTCYRAGEIFGVSSAILITQGFHLPRALYTCNMLGIQAIGVPADRREYLQRSSLFWNIREIPATTVALWEVHVSQPRPILGDPEPIFPVEAQ